MTGYRRFGSRAEGHPTPVLPWVDVATGSLGQGLPDGVGVALAGKYLDESAFRVWVLCGDSEMAEGSVWEALDKASHYKLSNLIVMVDVNRRGPTELSWDLETYRDRASAFGARVFVIDGHDPTQIDQAMAQAGDLTGQQPTVILARTLNTQTLTTAATATDGKIVIAEDHHPEGGLASAVVDALTAAGPIELTIKHLAVRELPGSGTSEELLHAAGISADHIAAAARTVTDQPSA